MAFEGIAVWGWWRGGFGDNSPNPRGSKPWDGAHVRPVAADQIVCHAIAPKKAPGLYRRRVVLKRSGKLLTWPCLSVPSTGGS